MILSWANKKTGSLFLLLFIALSCTKAIDFDQVKELEITPVIQSSLVFFNASAIDFVDSNTGSAVTVYRDFVLVDFFNDSFILENLDNVEFFFESKNSMNRRFEVDIELFDTSNQLVHGFTVSQGASSDGSDNTSDHLEIYNGSKLDLLKQTVAIVFTLKQVSGVPIEENTAGRIELKSHVTFYFKIRNFE